VFLLLLSYCDAPESWQFGLQDPATPIVEGMLFFHNYLMLFLIVIGFFVCWMLIRVIKLFNEISNKSPKIFNHSSFLEIIWTIFPAVILAFIALPSFNLLYSLDELVKTSLTLKVIGHQWYWTYEYSNFLLFNVPLAVFLPYYISFDSYLIDIEDLVFGSFRLLEVDNRTILPTQTHIKVLVTSTDVLHSWAIPSFGIKVDACPGRLSQTSLFLKREGTYYGQCSEICGVNHGFMPIVVRSVDSTTFYKWIILKGKI